MERKIQEQNRRIMPQCSVHPTAVHSPKGFAVPRGDIDKYLLAHQLNTDSKIKGKRGPTYQRASVRYDYMCYSYENCPFHLVRLDYTDHPGQSYLTIQKPHVHAGEQVVAERWTTYSEVSGFIRRFRGGLGARQLARAAEEYVASALALNDYITQQHRRQFPRYQLNVVAAVDVGQVVPDARQLRNRICYFKKQDRLQGGVFERPPAAPDQQEPLSIGDAQRISVLADQALHMSSTEQRQQLSLLHQVLASQFDFE